MTKQVIVIGAGPGGLASAILLAAAGVRVKIVERLPFVGGRTSSIEAQGYKFDLGPTFFLYPRVLEEILRTAGTTLRDEVPMERLDPQYRIQFGAGGRIDATPDISQMEREIAALSPADAPGFRRFLAENRTKLAAMEPCLETPFLGWQDLVNVRLLKMLPMLRPHQSVDTYLKRFFRDERVRLAFCFQSKYLGMSPFRCPSLFSILSFLEYEYGVFHPIGGCAAVTQAMARVAQRLGVEIHTNTRITQILTQGGSVTGMRTNHDEVIPLRAVVSNCDSVRTHRELISGAVGAKFEKRRTYEAACSGVVLYLGLKKRYDHLAHHDFVFSRDPHEEFDFIYKKGEPAPDPTCYLAATTCSEPATAPAGGEALYVLVHTPYLRPHHDWKKMLPAYRKTIMEKLKTTGQMPDIEDRIVFERTLTPQDIHDRYHVLNGAIYGLASHGTFLGAFKPGNRSPDLRGLYLAGGAAHPGPGMPMVLMSGWIAADTLDKDGVVERSADRARTPRPHEEELIEA